MATWTLKEIDGFIANLKSAYTSAISGKNYTINTGGTSRSVTRNDIVSLLNQIEYWQLEKSKLDGDSGIPTKFITPTNF
jgi:hypothetical protein